MLQALYLLRHIPPQADKFQIGLSLRVIGSEQGPALAFNRLFPARLDLLSDVRLRHFDRTHRRHQRSPLSFQSELLECLLLADFVAEVGGYGLLVIDHRFLNRSPAICLSWLVLNYA